MSAIAKQNCNCRSQTKGELPASRTTFPDSEQQGPELPERVTTSSSSHHHLRVDLTHELEECKSELPCKTGTSPWCDRTSRTTGCVDPRTISHWGKQGAPHFPSQQHPVLSPQSTHARKSSSCVPIASAWSPPNSRTTSSNEAAKAPFILKVGRVG